MHLKRHYGATKLAFIPLWYSKDINGKTDQLGTLVAPVARKEGIIYARRLCEAQYQRMRSKGYQSNSDNYQEISLSIIGRENLGTALGKISPNDQRWCVD